MHFEAGQELPHRCRACFETRPSGAPQHEAKLMMALRKYLILRRPLQRPSRRTHGADPARFHIMIGGSAPRAAADEVIEHGERFCGAMFPPG